MVMTSSMTSQAGLKVGPLYHFINKIRTFFIVIIKRTKSITMNRPVHTFHGVMTSFFPFLTFTFERWDNNILLFPWIVPKFGWYEYHAPNLLYFNRYLYGIHMYFILLSVLWVWVCASACLYFDVWDWFVYACIYSRTIAVPSNFLLFTLNKDYLILWLYLYRSIFKTSPTRL